MAKPFSGHSGNSAHLHLSLRRDGQPLFPPENGAENPLGPAGRRRAGGAPAGAVFGAPTVNSYKRFEPDTYAPLTAAWGGDNRSASGRPLIEKPTSTRIELRTPAADSNPYWLIASPLAADRGSRGARGQPPPKGQGNLYGTGRRCHGPLAKPWPRPGGQRDRDLFGEDAVLDYALLAEREWGHPPSSHRLGTRSIPHRA